MIKTAWCALEPEIFSEPRQLDARSRIRVLPSPNVQPVLVALARDDSSKDSSFIFEYPDSETSAEAVLAEARIKYGRRTGRVLAIRLECDLNRRPETLAKVDRVISSFGRAHRVDGVRGESIDANLSYISKVIRKNYEALLLQLNMLDP